MLTALFGRFFRHCIDSAARADAARVKVNVFDPDFMTDAEISAFLHGKKVNWEQIEIRRKSGAKIVHRVMSPAEKQAARAQVNYRGMLPPSPLPTADHPVSEWLG